MKTKIYTLLLIGLSLCSCEKTIDIDFHSVVPLYYVEGWITPYETIVRVSQTKDLSDTTSVCGINNAKVTITDEDGRSFDVPYSDRDYYISNESGEVGKTYRLDVEVDGQHFSSTSKMYRMATINTFRLIWKNMLSERYIFGDIRIQDFPNEINYYYIHIYRNGIPYRSAVLKDDTNPGGELQQLFAFNKEGSTDQDRLREGDELEAEVRTIDERSYEYLYSLLLMDNTGTNPIENFTGGCLGYFSAFSGVGRGNEFRTEYVEEEE